MLNLYMDALQSQVFFLLVKDLQGVSSEAIIRMDFMHQRMELVIKRELQHHHRVDKFYEIIADVGKKHQIGNCGEQIAVAYLYLKNDKILLA